MIRTITAALLLGWFSTTLIAPAEAATNIVYILCDDLGIGDVGCFNPAAKIPTPALDALAAQGMIFTDAHSSSAVCTPTRYGVLTGRYNWRSKLQRGVLGGLSPRLIEPGRETVASFLKKHGYHTACVGKWHLGMDWARPEGKPVSELTIESPDQVWNVDYAQPIANGPNAVGFDYYFGISASLDMVPYTYIENDRVVKLPTLDKRFPQFSGRVGGFTRQGPTAEGFEVENVLPDLTRKSVEYIGSRAEAARGGHPFFLYVPLASPHTPIAPTNPWLGKTGLNAYADFVAETDDAIGQIAAAVDRAGLTKHTLFIVTSDNGCSPQAKFDELAAQGHHPSGIYRGHKADIFEGGHRIPFIVRWPARVAAGTRSDQTVCLTDLMATCADIVGTRLPDHAGEDSVSLLGALTQQSDGPRHEAVVHHSINGSFAIRQGKWKLILCADSGGWSAPRPGRDKTAGLPARQLYDLETDPGEQTNLIDQHSDVAAQLAEVLERYVAQGRSTPGAAQANAVEVVIEPKGR